jgi:hypothetical protein
MYKMVSERKRFGTFNFLRISKLNLIRNFWMKFRAGQVASDSMHEFFQDKLMGIFS